LVLVDSDVDRDLGVSKVATNNKLAGISSGKYAKTFVKENSKIGIMSHLEGASTAVERIAGIKVGLGEDAKRIEEIQYCDANVEEAYTLTKEMLNEDASIDIVIATNEPSAVGVARAISELELKEKVSLIGFDNSIEEIQFMEQGVVRGTIIQKPFNMGYLAIKQALAVSKGEEVQMNVNSESKLITKGNMYQEDNQRLLYPFIGQR
jgi:ribose transport system substrate-binding protein